MKQVFGKPGHSFLAPTDGYEKLMLVISRQLSIPPAEPIIADLGKAFEILDFQLGDSLTCNASSSGNSLPTEQDSQYFYAICQGRVRLLSFDGQKQPQVSVQLLSEGDTFGGDSCFAKTSLPYQAVAAEQVVQVARIALAQLLPRLAQLPELESQWKEAAQKRQCLIFFKTLTNWCSLPSHRLQQLASYLVEREIPAGESLAQATAPEAGRFWLCRGQIEVQGRSLEVGSAWGYPETNPLLGIAQSDLSLYHLPKEHWQAVAPLLTTVLEKTLPSSQTTDETNGHHPGNKSLPQVQPMSPPPPIASNGRKPSLARRLVPEPPAEEQAVDFPKPNQRRRWFARGYPFVGQHSSSDCGAACLAAISQYWGKSFSLNSLRELAGIGRTGASLNNLAKAAESLGYQARPVRASFNRLVEQKNPWIAHWQGDHYIVVYRVKGDRVLVADPARGRQSLSRPEFLASWTGYALLLDPTERLYEVPDQKRSLGRFMKILWPYRSLGLQIIALSVLIQIFGLIAPLFTQIILDSVVVNKSMTTLNIFALGALIFGIWSLGLSSVRQYLLSYLTNRLDLTAIGGFINHALRLPLKFFESRRVGDIITRVQENQKIQRFLIGQVMLSWLNFVTGFVYLGLMLYYNWQLTLLVVGLIPFIVILTLAATPLLRRVSRERFNASADQNSALVEMMTGIATVKASASEQELRWRWEERLTHQLNVRFKGQKLGINLGAISGLINSIGSTALMWYGASLVIQDHLTIGQFVAFNMMKGHIISPVIALANLWDELQEVLISVERLNDVFETEPEDPAGTSKLVLPNLRGDVRFENITFRYDTEEERNALQNISFEVKAGETIAIVGRSGSGKTTLVKLLQGLYYPTSGYLWLDDHDVRHVATQSLRSQLGVVPQECFLFSGTILENITLYRPEFTLEQAIEVAKLAEAHAFIQAMPLGYNTKVGERGTNLSGGQRQRIAIARALLGNPRILILDEATSSLDAEAERRFQRNLERVSRERTTFIIAHRLSTVRNADSILVLDRGLLVERGTHQELMAQQGLYYNLAHQQLNL